MNKKIKLLIFMCLCCLSMGHIALAEEAAVVADTDYGYYAENYLKEICTYYPERVFKEDRSRMCGDYIIDKLIGMGYKVHIQDFEASNPKVAGRNIYCEKRGLTDKLIVLCAHYDCVNTMGCDDNGSGVAALLEVAARILNMERPDCNIRFIFFDDEEQGYIGSKAYVNSLSEEELGRILYVINIDSIAAGDNLYIHGGTPEGELTELREMALGVADKLKLSMTTHPEVEGIPAGTRYWGSDHHYFAEKNIPYIYLEANIYSSESADGNPVHYQTANPEVTNGQVMHTAFDNYDVLEKLFPGRIRDHLTQFVVLTTDLAINIDSNGIYSGKYYLAGTAREPETVEETTTEEVVETTEETSEETTEQTTEETAEETTENVIKETTENVLKETTKDVTTNDDKANSDEPENHSRVVVILIVLGLAAGGICVAYFAIKGKKNS